MNVSAFEDLLDRCGGDATDWPPGARAAADRLLTQSSEARRALSAQRSAEAWLREADVAAPAHLAQRAMQAAQAPRPRGPVLLTARVGWAAAAVAAVTLGLATGWAHGGGEDPAQTVALALYAPGEAADAG